MIGRIRFLYLPQEEVPIACQPVPLQATAYREQLGQPVLRRPDCVTPAKSLFAELGDGRQRGKANSLATRVVEDASFNLSQQFSCVNSMKPSSTITSNHALLFCQFNDAIEAQPMLKLLAD